MAPPDPPTTSCQQAADILKYAVENRRFEIERFWQRSLFFWGLIAAAFVAYGALLAKPGTRSAALVISCFGLLCSVAWALQTRGSKYWQEVWEQKVKRVEKEVLGVPLFDKAEDVVEKGLWGARRYSVSKLAIAMADFTGVVWFGLVADAMLQSSSVVVLMLAATLTACAIVMLAFWARSSR